MATRTMHLRLPSALGRLRRRGDDGLTPDEREEYAARWRSGQGGSFTREEWDRYEALARAKRHQRLG